jgi:membrane-bound acyltransferase YfiQ involved in biofilm formation|tara:strand:+ start:90 stop:725 length:636 start_codon:yes stop_codon:yes gene_type:complete
MKKVDDINDYKALFVDEKVRESALKQALDIRKFEIELYWKRTAYFWTLIAATFAGYVAIQSKNPDADLSLLVSSIGLCFSIGWYFVNRGSKYWQGNWERHVDLLENEFSGPLYKLTPSHTEYRFLKLNSAYPFSVSRVNQILSLFVVMIWCVLVVSSACRCSWLPMQNNLFSWSIAVLVLICIFSLAAFGRTKRTEDNKTICFECREYKSH